ncbi:helix-turn-helix domain-containing protein [Pseudoruegeria sp. HB172150]|uniref:helix-turn-helix domain-containing protein n=1 Tax=Pseudoruegeria sp. HB172150 TaxID=2721164 RepID=UPI00155755F7|nr:helix-turn-helix transcriptional regulator [Pseudoruegeria sp. HB172150]
MDDDVAQRLRRLQAEAGLTVQQMAERCDLSKASLGNYMRVKNPQRPGFDAVIAIANGMGVSTDWLAGLTSDRTPPTASKHDEALLVYTAVHSLLSRLAEQQEESKEPIFSGKEVAGKPIWHHSVKTMLDYLEMREIPTAGDAKDSRDGVDELVQLLVVDRQEKSTGP